jgi:hypothetical protein
MFSFKQPKKPAPTPKKPTEKRALSFGARHQLENSAIHRSGSIQNELDRVRSLGPILHAVGPAEFGLTALGQQAVEHAVGGALEVEPRIHHDAAATGFARAFSARAIAHGADIFVSPRDTGEKPADDRTVLSHELAHTVERSPVSAVPHLSRFEGGEHMYLGDSGWDSATKLLIDQLVEKEVAGIQDPPERVRKAQKKRAELEHVFRNRLEGKSTKKFSYGAGVGLAGDHFETAHGHDDGNRIALDE